MFHVKHFLNERRKACNGGRESAFNGVALSIDRGPWPRKRPGTDIFTGILLLPSSPARPQPVRDTANPRFYPNAYQAETGCPGSNAPAQKKPHLPSHGRERTGRAPPLFLPFFTRLLLFAPVSVCFLPRPAFSCYPTRPAPRSRPDLIATTSRPDYPARNSRQLHAKPSAVFPFRSLVTSPVSSCHAPGDSPP